MAAQPGSPVETAYDVHPRGGNSVADIAAEWLAASRDAKSAFPRHRQIRWGKGDALALDVFSASAHPRGLVLFLHGGFWLQGSKDIGAFPAPAFDRAGLAYASASYGLAPHFSLPELIGNVREIYDRCIVEAADLGIDAGRIAVIGHSAGAHLAAWLARTGSPAPLPRGLVLISGIFDLVPLLGIERLAPLRLDHRTAQRLSIAGDQISAGVDMIVTAGTEEATGFIDQSRAFASTAKQAGHNVEMIMVDGADHFDIARSLGDPVAPVTSAALALFT